MRCDDDQSEKFVPTIVSTRSEQVTILCFFSFRVFGEATHCLWRQMQRVRFNDNNLRSDTARVVLSLILVDGFQLHKNHSMFVRQLNVIYGLIKIAKMRVHFIFAFVHSNDSEFLIPPPPPSHSLRSVHLSFVAESVKCRRRKTLTFPICVIQHTWIHITQAHDFRSCETIRIHSLISEKCLHIFLFRITELKLRDDFTITELLLLAFGCARESIFRDYEFADSCRIVQLAQIWFLTWWHRTYDGEKKKIRDEY